MWRLGGSSPAGKNVVFKNSLLTKLFVCVHALPVKIIYCILLSGSGGPYKQRKMYLFCSEKKIQQHCVNFEVVYSRKIIL